MALLGRRLKENVAGDFYVDSTCIDCDLCRQIAPHTFKDAGEQSIVYSQPQTPQQEFEALKALVTCPTASIGTVSHKSAKAAVEAYPENIAENVYFCGFASESSFGASSYLIVRPSGNVLVDSPRFAKPLADRIGKLGGIRFLFLTHRDDVADHDQWVARFHAERIMHADDAGRLRSRIEHLIQGTEAVSFDQEFTLIPTPGHTRGHMVLLYKQFLFTGDHLWWSDNYHSLHASPGVCWYSWSEQTRSMERLLDYRFEWVLPGHGRRAHADSHEMHGQIEIALARMKESA
jgi:glyoxylase-like metal-dependent hydrolase (beta-lactamase superfamily II)/ferredoxin